jgi:DNA-binding transcriptional regulator YhcF (GntR family)
VDTVDISIDRNSSQPPFRQIRKQINTAITTGELTVGTRLPAVRTLAKQLATAPGTVARAYRDLEVSGLLDTRGRHGTYVADPVDERSRHRRELAKLAADYAAAASQWAIPPTESVGLVEQALADTADRTDHSPG